LVLGFLGGYDDFLKLKYKNPKGLSARRKMGIQLLLGAAIACYLLYPHSLPVPEEDRWFSAPSIKENAAHQSVPVTLQEYTARIYAPFFKDPILQFGGAGLILAGLFIMFVVAGSSNAVNLTDGLDGLASGCLIIVAGVLALFAFLSNHIELARYLNIVYVEGSGEIAIYLSAFIGACLGFLWYNSHPAQVFMGDTGSLTLGGIIGVCAILLKRELLLGLIGGIFVAEAASVILQVASFKLRNKKRIFLCAPLHHHFEYKGWAETKVVTRFWIVGLLLGIIGVASLKFQ
jgi:phospho-N-acetylmuramoyl-pentapeptide-transferase